MSNLANGAEVHRGGARAPCPAEMLATRNAEVGGLAIRRALPQRARRLVGAWCFLDHFGPQPLGGGPGLRVGPHPHIGLQTVTWLLDGEVLHRDSLGSRRLIRPGQLNLMTAGDGIAHSEETPVGHGSRLHGLQCWIALPDPERHREPAFEHLAQLPVLERDGLRATLLAGEAWGERSPARVYSPLVGLDVEVLEPGRRTLPLVPEYEHALLVTGGEVDCEGTRMRPGALYYLGAKRGELALANTAPARAFLFGGSPFGEEVLLWWNFVARTGDELRRALRDWQRNSPRFGEVHGYEGARLDAPPLTVEPRRG